MIKSMTGFGKAHCQIEGKKVNIEVKTLNSKSFDVSLKIPQSFRDKEQLIRNFVSQELNRGKVEVYITVENTENNTEVSINKPLFARYFNELKNLANELNTPLPEDIFSTITRLPEVLKQDQKEADDESWAIIEMALKEAIEQADLFRQSEGKHLAEDLMTRIAEIKNLLSQIDPLESQRVEQLKTRLIKGLNDLKEAGQPDPNRFEQELIFYLEKLDITEEKVRLSKHLQYFEETMQNEAASGKKLGFISQEIGREINTIGSKANDAEIQRIVVQMKDELEKIKEQLLNIL